jgi:hypothetical protein
MRIGGMTDQIVTVQGCRPWQPAPGTELIAVYNQQDRPLSGLLRQNGLPYLFWCIAGQLGDNNIWAYTLIEDSDVSRLSDDDAFDETFDELTLRPRWVALASNGQILISTEFDSHGIESEEEIVQSAAAALRAVADRTREATMGVLPQAEPLETQRWSLVNEPDVSENEFLSLPDAGLMAAVQS